MVRGSDGALLIDAGFSCRGLEQRLRRVGVEPGTVRAILLTHEHGDHSRGVARFVQRHRPVLYGTRGTFLASSLRRLHYRQLTYDWPEELAGFEVTAFPVPHDARDPVGFVLEDGGGRRLGLVSDLGCRTQRSWRALRDLDAVVLESNHDLRMLETGPYPFALKRRVASRRGHLCNEEASRGLEALACDALATVVLYHLSRTNNRPDIAAEASAEVLSRLGAAARLVVSEQSASSPWLPVAAAVGAATASGSER